MNQLKEFERRLAYHFSEALEYPFSRPYWIYVSLSHKCTYSCQMCGVVKILKGYELPAETLKKAFDEIASWGWSSRVVLTGGEPFLREDIFELIGYAKEKGLDIESVSNGSLIDENLASKIISSGLNNIAISLDGAKEETHDYIREKGAFKKAIKAIGNMVSEKKGIGSGPQISVWTTIMKENVRELYDLITLVRDLGVECLVYHPVVVTQDDMQNTSSSAKFWIRENEIQVLKEQVDIIVKYQRENGLVAFLHDPYLWVRHFEGNLTKQDWKCNPFVFLNIGPDGETRSCGSAFGNIKELDLDSCLNTEEASGARKLMKLCKKPCLQTCWAYPESDNLLDITNTFVDDIKNEKDRKALLREASRILDKYEKTVLTYRNE